MVTEQVSFETLFRDVFPRLVSFGALKTGNIDTARELAQEAMLRAHRHWDSVRHYNSPQAWCIAVMSNLLIDQHRSNVRNDRLIRRLKLLRPTAFDEEALDASLDEWNELLEGLSERQRLVITLYYAADLPITQIADSLGTTEGGVKASLFKARQNLRQSMGSEDLDV